MLTREDYSCLVTVLVYRCYKTMLGCFHIKEKMIHPLSFSSSSVHVLTVHAFYKPTKRCKHEVTWTDKTVWWFHPVLSELHGPIWGNQTLVTAKKLCCPLQAFCVLMKLMKK